MRFRGQCAGYLGRSVQTRPRVYQRNRPTAKGLRFNALFFGVSSKFFPKQIDTFVGEGSLPFCIINGIVVCVGNNASRIIAIRQINLLIIFASTNRQSGERTELTTLHAAKWIPTQPTADAIHAKTNTRAISILPSVQKRAPKVLPDPIVCCAMCFPHAEHLRIIVGPGVISRSLLLPNVKDNRAGS